MKLFGYTVDPPILVRRLEEARLRQSGKAAGQNVIDTTDEGNATRPASVAMQNTCTSPSTSRHSPAGEADHEESLHVAMVREDVWVSPSRSMRGMNWGESVHAWSMWTAVSCNFLDVAYGHVLPLFKSPFSSIPYLESNCTKNA